MSQTENLKVKLGQAGCLFLCEEPMRRHTSFHIGGPAEIFITPASEAQAMQALSLCHAASIPVYVIGNGSNLLVADEGLRGAVIAFSQPMSSITRKGNTLSAQAGVTLLQLCRFAQRQGLGGLEFAYGIPGSVGGAVYMNAGAYGGEMKDVVVSARVLDKMDCFLTIPAEQAGFAYRSSRFQKEGQIVCSADFELNPDTPEAIDTRMKDIMARRVTKQPLEFPSAGSAFKRPSGAYAAALIEECGLKGFSVGGAQVSTKHSGFVINTGGATCRDVLALLEAVKNEVCRRTGVLLEPEIKYLA
ncbi:UDP-N-acetylmuramate dehydrogenase [Oscillospiraceae bacterium LTW-04]|nr:UDP-N-acetylmuramate dehydrogenase [Oscillospiraceae bacterium MB24-C1]